MSTAPRRSSFGRILCPIDFSAHALSALRYALELARRSGGHVTVLAATDPLLNAAAAAAAYDVKALIRETDTQLRRFVSRAGGNPADVTILSSFGKPADEIAKTIRRINADVVVMGSHGLRGAGKWFFGSTTERTLRKSNVPVLVVPRLRRRKGPSARSPLQQWPGKRVVIAVDLADYRIGDVKAAVEIVRSLGATALLVYAVPPTRLPAWMRFNAGVDERRRVVAAKDRLNALNRKLRARGDCEVVFGDAAEQIAICAESAKAGLIVLTLKSSSALLGPHRGSVTYRLVTQAVAPVLALPAR
jgi:nucleotide-binding universal stress UspA family protein